MTLPPIFRRNNPLVFPGAGRQPGFDPAHPAAKGAYISTIPFGTTFVNLLNGSIGSPGGTIAAATTAPFGPTLNLGSSGTVFVTFSGVQTSVFATATFATFFYTANIANTPSLMQNSSTANTGLKLFISPPNVLNGIAVGSNGLDVGLGLPVKTDNTPYFVAVSASGAICNAILVDLKRGTFATNHAAIRAITQPTNTVTLANLAVQTSSLVGFLGPCMMSTVFLSITALEEWGAAPWDFWYPPTVERLIFRSLTMKVSTARSFAGAFG